MPKTLYISDLDGTLLNERSRVSDYTRDTLNRLIAGGLNFSVATARTAFSTGAVLRGLDLRLPTIQMNGVFLYDFAERRYLDVQYLSDSAISEIADVMRKIDASPLIYTVRDNVQTTYYTRIANQWQQYFYDVRTQEYGQVIPQIQSIDMLSGQWIIYFTLIDSYERLAPLSDAVAGIAGISRAFYRDVSANNGSWLLEIFSERASKSNGLLRLKRLCGFDRVIGFGDNHNDLPLFDVCDECYAVANAVDEVKSAAAAVIGANTDDGVARWLEENGL
jgi:Cof subfamily protein (haloacid dehalogenase superfamily)